MAEVLEVAVGAVGVAIVDEVLGGVGADGADGAKVEADGDVTGAVGAGFEGGRGRGWC